MNNYQINKNKTIESEVSVEERLKLRKIEKQIKKNN